MSTSWKPALLDRYWTISIEPADGYVYPARWWDDGFDKNVHSFGNCFQTREQAEAGLEKIKKVLLEAHDDNN